MESKSTVSSLKRRKSDGVNKHEKKIAIYSRGEIQAFLNLLDDPDIQEFLKLDVCNILADKYLIAMVFVYFVRSQIPLEEYNRLNFFGALNLAQDMEEEIIRLKYWIMYWCPGNCYNEKQINLRQAKENIWRLVGFRCLVSKQCCNQVMKSMPDHVVWKRERDEVHSGSLRHYYYVKCRLCRSHKSGLNFYCILCLDDEIDDDIDTSSEFAT